VGIVFDDRVIPRKRESEALLDVRFRGHPAENVDGLRFR